MVVPGHRKDCPPVWWSEACVLLCASSVACVNDEFPKAGYLQLVLSLHISGLLGPLKKREFGVPSERRVGHTLVSAEMGLRNRQLNPITVPLTRCCLIFWKPEYPLSAG